MLTKSLELIFVVRCMYSWFSRDAIKLKKYQFFWVLEQSKTYVFANFQFERFLRFDIKYRWICYFFKTLYLNGSARTVINVKRVFFFRFCFLTSSCIKTCISRVPRVMNTNFPSITSQCWFPVAAMLVPSRGTPTWRLHAKVDKFGQNIVAHIWKLDKTWILVTLFAYSSSFICQILGIYLVYFPFLFLIAWPKIIIYSQTYERKWIAYTTGVIFSRFQVSEGKSEAMERSLKCQSSLSPNLWGSDYDRGAPAYV